jgi:hypothetical protein
MAIGPIELNGTIGRSQDFSIIKHNEDTKNMHEQANIQNQLNAKIEHHLNQVRDADNTESPEHKFDAKEKGDNEYTGDGGKQRKNDNQKKDGKVIVKNKGGFDIMI